MMLAKVLFALLITGAIVGALCFFGAWALAWAVGKLEDGEG